MSETLSILPFSFWVVIALLGGGGIWSLRKLHDGLGIPLLAVLGTTTAWYVGDAFYNDYANNHALLFTPETLDGAWWQVAWFLTVLLVASPLIHQWINRRYLDRRSGVMEMFNHGIDQPEIQKQLNVLFRGCASVWVILFLIAIVILKDQVIYYLFPYLGYNITPWAHGQIGSGLDCFAILGLYLNLLTASMFGVVAALATNRSVRSSALLFCFLSWPTFIFDRTRNSMLAILIPAVICWVFLRLRGRIWKKILMLAVIFCAVNIWMKFVIANRSGTTITAALQQKKLNLVAQGDVHNEGLNMFEELCWISTFIDNGHFHVNWGENYFAELVNPIPRGLWPGKPLIGLDYAIARGHHTIDSSGTVDTTIATGFIGQGVVNFGRFFGPMAAALLMSLWVAWLVRLDLNVHALGRLPLYSLGLIMTFNLGRDITLITLYPFVFGALVVWWLDRPSPRSATNAPAHTTAQPNRAPRPVSGPSAGFARRQSAGGFVKRSVFRPVPAHTTKELGNSGAASDGGQPSS